MTVLAVWAGTIAASLAAIHFTARAVSHEHQRGEHPNRRCWICGASIEGELT